MTGERPYAARMNSAPCYKPTGSPLQQRSRSLTCALKIANAACFLVVLRFGMARREGRFRTVIGESHRGGWQPLTAAEQIPHLRTRDCHGCALFDGASVRDGTSRRGEISYEALSPQHPAISQKCQAICVQVGRMAHRELAGWTVTHCTSSSGAGKRTMSWKRSNRYYFARDKFTFFAYNSQ